jgi:hypothetical protein
MPASLRKTLIDSHVAAVTVVALPVSAFGMLVRAISDPVSQIISYLLVAVATNNITYVHRTWDFATHYLSYQATLFMIPIAFSSLAAAWLFSFWVFGMGPLRSLGSYRNKLSRKSHA